MFKHLALHNGVDLYVNPTKRFRTTLVQVFVSRPLDELYSRYSLLASVLKRGSSKYPTSIELAKRWDDLYGASFSANVYKLGEEHVFELSLELANERYLISPEPLLSEGLHTIAQMLASPHLPEGLLDSEHVEQERENLLRAIDSLFNDKAMYSSVRCIEEMCKSEPYARFELGDKVELCSLNNKELTAFYHNTIPQNTVRIVISGDIDPQAAQDICSAAFTGINSAAKSTPVRHIEVSEVRVKHETQDINQGKLVMGYRTGIDCSSSNYPALVMYNGILGGFPHSKLFANVREKASLAYDCSSTLLPVKGLMLIRAGIAVDKYDQALEIINNQLHSMENGEISSDELENTRLALVNQLKADADRPARLARSYVERLTAGADYSNDDLRERLLAVTTEDVVAVATRVKLDTIYFLRGKE